MTISMPQAQTLIVIPARAGSKGLSNKNMRLLLGKPLVLWTVEQCLTENADAIVHVSTDSMEIATICRQAGAEVPYIRPSELATDTASTYDVVQHAIRWYRENHSLEFQFVVVAEPTAPLRRSDELSRALHTLRLSSDGAQSIVSVGRAHTHPSYALVMTQGFVNPVNEAEPMPERRQDLAPIVTAYGTVFAAHVSHYEKHGTFFTKKCKAQVLERWQSYEIDDLYDFVCVEAVLRHRIASFENADG